MANADRTVRWLVGRGRAATVLVALLVTGACGEAEESPDLVARVGSYELTVDDMVSLLVDQEDLPMDASVVQSVAELWIDYTLLAEAAADDSTFRDVDFAGVVRPFLEQDMVMQLRDSVIQVDTAITDEELAQQYAAESPELELRARHILLTYPPQATQAQRDSVGAQLLDLRAQILAGASFEDMARRYSQDPGTAQAGGDLGFFGRGEMMAPFEEAVLALEPGEVSGVVQTPLGLHLIRLDERRARDFAEVAADYRLYVQSLRYAVAESTFIADLEGRSAPVVADGALGVARELARAPETRLSGSAARRSLVQWDGGSYTAGDLLEVLRGDQPALREEILRRSDEDLTNFLRAQARRKLLIEEARRRGLEPAPSTVDSLGIAAREQLRDAARSLGLLQPDRAPGEDVERAIARAVRQAITDNLSGASRLVPLGLVSFQLREGVPVVVFGDGIGTVLLRVAEVRATRGQSALEESLAPPETPADTAETPADTTVR